MMHIVQVVLWGIAEAPLVFSDEAKAQAAFVQCTGKSWEQRYAAYCEHHGVNRDDFASAQAFVKTLDVSEKSTINLWTVFPDDGLCEATPVAESERFRLLAKEVVAVKDGLARLLGDISKVVDGLAQPAATPAVAETVESPEAPPTAAPATSLPKAEADPAKYTTKEWSVFVSEVRRLFSGSRNECYLLPRDMWRHDVYGNFTVLEYWDWVADRMEIYKKKAEDARYTVVTDHDSPDYLRFANAEGVASEENYDSEWEAWCAAGLYLESTR